MQMDRVDALSQDVPSLISSHASKMLRKNFGRGPESCKAFLSEKFLVLYVRGFISTMEETLIRQSQRDQVERARDVIVQHAMEEMRGMIELLLEQEVGSVFHDWNFPNNSGVMIFLLQPVESREGERKPAGVDIARLEAEVARLSQLVQKIPNRILTHPVSQNVYLVERDGILIPIEKALVERGFTDELKLTKDELEKNISTVSVSLTAYSAGRF